MIEITRDIASKVLSIVDAGLVSGVGKPIAGQMCVEAAVCFALGEPHGDEPSCVAPALRAFKIVLNDAAWSSNKVRAAGLRRLALVQLGSKGVLNEIEFAKRLSLLSVNKTVPFALRIAASMKMPAEHSAALEEAAIKCERAENLDAARDAASAASDAARYAARYAARAARDAARYAARYAARAASYAASDAASAASDAASDAARDAARAARAARDAASDAARDAARAARDAARYAARYAARAASYAASDAASAASDAASDAARAARDAARAASYAASDAASDAARDKELATTAEAVVQVLISMNVPGVEWLDLAPLAEAA